ncbi:MAG TPA: amidohydrolase family protein [Kineosporiaceae bacterium]|nr:amidohydrolase family protein [Kineosporiaceae bacterium]
MIVDAHVHVFLRADAAPRVVDDLVPPEREAPVEDLLAVMESAGVERAVLVPLATEDDYVAEVLGEHPSRFAAVAVADAAVQGRESGTDPVAALERRRESFPFHAVRTQWLGDPGAPLADSPMLPVLRHMAEHGLALWTYLTRDQIGLLEQIPATVPDLAVVLNHLGFCPHDMRVDAHGRPAFEDPFPPGSLDPVLRLAEHPGTRVMFSGQYALSREDPPYRDLDPVVRALAGAFGPRRMLWASDYPWTRDVPGYATLLGLAEQALPDASAEDLAAIHGGTALELFPHLRPAEVT